jgi:hypothetical protein
MAGNTVDGSVTENVPKAPARSRLRCGFIGSTVVAVVNGEPVVEEV